MLELCYGGRESNIMRKEQYPSERLARLLKSRKIAGMDELKETLGTSVDMTVFRKLQELGYITSYSHGGRYYTLSQIPEFDDVGLWSFRSVWFSRHGTLVATAEACVESAEAGYFSSELEELLHVPVKDALRNLVREDRISRETIRGKFLYCSADADLRKEQLRAREIYESAAISAPLPMVGPGVRVVPDELQAAIILFFSMLDEQQRRLYAGLEALKLGHGGDTKIAELLGLDVGTVSRGREQLLSRDVIVDRVRKAGGGRLASEKKHRKSSHESRS